MPSNKTLFPNRNDLNASAQPRYCSKPTSSYAWFLPVPSQKWSSRISSDISISFPNLFLWSILLPHANSSETIWHIYWCKWKQSICKYLRSFYPISLIISKGPLIRPSMRHYTGCSTYTSNLGYWSKVLSTAAAFIEVEGCSEWVCKIAYLCIWISSWVFKKTT